MERFDLGHVPTQHEAWLLNWSRNQHGLRTARAIEHLLREGVQINAAAGAPGDGPDGYVLGPEGKFMTWQAVADQFGPKPRRRKVSAAHRRTCGGCVECGGGDGN